MAADIQGIRWLCPLDSDVSDDAVNAIERRINCWLKDQKVPWKLSHGDEKIRLLSNELVPMTAKSADSTKTTQHPSSNKKIT
ncbi:MAG TPA: hypothetical protein VFG20_12225 [Planctomycetaceae bacterium]|nr:hypothetical protein [Planctomycetaceae bacterium]